MSAWFIPRQAAYSQQQRPNQQRHFTKSAKCLLTKIQTINLGVRWSRWKPWLDWGWKYSDDTRGCSPESIRVVLSLKRQSEGVMRVLPFIVPRWKPPGLYSCCHYLVGGAGKEGRSMTNRRDPHWAMCEHQIWRSKAICSLVSTVHLKGLLGPSCRSRSETKPWVI